MKIGPLAGRLPDVMDPGYHGVRTTHWIRGFMAFRLAQRTRTADAPRGSGAGARALDGQGAGAGARGGAGGEYITTYIIHTMRGEARVS